MGVGVCGCVCVWGGGVTTRHVRVPEYARMSVVGLRARVAREFRTWNGEERAAIEAHYI